MRNAGLAKNFIQNFCKIVGKTQQTFWPTQYLLCCQWVSQVFITAASLFWLEQLRTVLTGGNRGRWSRTSFQREWHELDPHIHNVNQTQYFPWKRDCSLSFFSELDYNKAKVASLWARSVSENVLFGPDHVGPQFSSVTQSSPTLWFHSFQRFSNFFLKVLLSGETLPSAKALRDWTATT